jgi:hypothetical protein
MFGTRIRVTATAVAGPSRVRGRLATPGAILVSRGTLGAAQGLIAAPGGPL